MKKKIELIACVGNYKSLSSFETIEELNSTVRSYRDLIISSVKRSDVQVRLTALLELLKRHSCKYIGVSFMCKNTIAEKLEISYKTVQRLVKKLEELNMIKQYEMKRHTDMNQTANAIVILPIENNMSDKTPPQNEEKCPTKTISISLKQKIKRLNTRNTVKLLSNVDKSVDNITKANFVAHWVPEQFSELANYYFNDAKVIQEFWKVVKQNNRVTNHAEGIKAFTNSQELRIGVKAFKEYVMKVKSGMVIDNIFGYFNGIVSKLMDKYYFDDEFMAC